MSFALFHFGGSTSEEKDTTRKDSMATGTEDYGNTGQPKKRTARYGTIPVHMDKGCKCKWKKYDDHDDPYLLGCKCIM